MPKPDYLTPKRAAELIDCGKVPGSLLCPHCRMVLYVGEKPVARGRKRPAAGCRRGASRSKPPASDPIPAAPHNERRSQYHPPEPAP